MSQFMKMYRFVDCVFSQPLLPWLHKSGGEGLIKSNGWLLDEIKIALNKKVRNQYDSFVALLVQKIPLPEMQPYRALMSENSTATKTAAVIFLLLLQCKQDEALQNVARKNRGNSCRIPRLSERDKNPQGLLLVAVGGAAASIKAGEGLLKD